MQDGIYDKFLSEYTKVVSGIKVGYGLDEGVTLGPLVSDRSITKVNNCLVCIVIRNYDGFQTDSLD